jgi:hypothetical protein
MLCSICMSSKNYILNLRKGMLQFSHFCIENQHDAINACAEWIESQKNITNIEWVTEWKSFYESLLLLQPELNLADTKISQGGITTLEMCYQSRSCRIYFGIKDKPKWQFSWDNHPMFELELYDNIILADFLHHWLILGDLPSKLQQTFPNLNIGKMALFWEQKDYEKALKVESWNRVEESFNYTKNNEYFPNMIPLLFVLRARNYDEILWASSQSHTKTLILSNLDTYDKNIKEDEFSYLFFCSFRDREFRLEVYDTWESWSDASKAISIFDKIQYNNEIDALVNDFIDNYNLRR